MRIVLAVVALVILVSISFSGLAQDRSPARFPILFQSYFQEDPEQDNLPENAIVRLETDFSNGWEGWTQMDLTGDINSFWQVSTYNASGIGGGGPENHSWWCGKTYQYDCGTGDFNGYGNNWDAYLSWSHAINPNVPHTLRVSADLNLDTEAGFDLLTLGYRGPQSFVPIATFSGQLVNESIDESFTVTPGDLADDLVLVWHFHSDGRGSDEDCDRPSVGAAQIDDIRVYIDGGLVSSEDNENELENEWSDNWPRAGNFSKIRSGLWDVDGCRGNSSGQVTFIDDGLVELTGGSHCISWCYGEAGFIVSPTGGLAGREYGIQNEIWSPEVSVTDLPFSSPNFHLNFDVYRHESLTTDSPGIFYYWKVRWLDSAGEAPDSWQSSNYYYGEPAYTTHHHDLTGFIDPAAEKIQVALGVIDVDQIWGWDGLDGTPAPYFDDVVITAYQGPEVIIQAEESDLAQDNFPTQGYVDFGDLASNHIRVDAARNLAAPEHLMNTPQDGLICRVVSTGSPITTPPVLHYTVGANPLFNPYRLPPTGMVEGVPVPRSENLYAFFLPDNGLVYPGDILHYYITAENDATGSATLPSDISGYGVFPGDPGCYPLGYPSKFTMRGLPSVKSTTPGDQPKILFWNDFGGRGEESKWIHALENLGYHLSQGYDLYYTNQPSSALGNGLGGRATPDALAGYDAILYSSGDLGAFTLSHGDFVTDAGFDLALVEQWLEFGNKNLLVTGSNLIYDLNANAGAFGLAFAENWLGVQLITRNIREQIPGSYPEVTAIAGNAVFTEFVDWAVGPSSTGCPLTWINGIEPRLGASRCAEFIDQGGNPGYPFAAAVNFERPEYDYKSVCLPYDLMDIVYPPSKAEQPAAARTEVLEEILRYFEIPPPPPGCDPCLVPDIQQCYATRLHPGVPVSVFSVPGGNGDPLSNCFQYPEVPSPAVRVIETITLHVVCDNSEPIPNYPSEDMWLESDGGGLSLCGAAATSADISTDVLGRTTFSRTYSCGGHFSPEGSELLKVFINGEGVPGADFQIYFNSPDINGDCRVNLTDIAMFTQDYFGGYTYRSDFHADRAVNGIDLQYFAENIGASSTKKTAAQDIPGERYSGNSTIGLFADSDCTSRSLDIEPNTEFSLYLVVQSSNPENHLMGWECMIEVPDNVDIKEWQLGGDALNLLDAPDFAVGLAQAKPLGNKLVLAVAKCIALDKAPAIFRLHPATVSSLEPAFPAIATGKDGVAIRIDGLKVAADNPGGPAFQLNTDLSLPEGGGVPSQYALHPNSPNPFNPQTEIRFDLPADGPVAVVVYGLDGRRVANLVSEFRTRGTHVVVWNGEDDSGRVVSSGVYFCHMKAGDFVQTRRMVMLK